MASSKSSPLALVFFGAIAFFSIGLESYHHPMVPRTPVLVPPGAAPIDPKDSLIAPTTEFFSPEFSLPDSLEIIVPGQETAENIIETGP